MNTRTAVVHARQSRVNVERSEVGFTVFSGLSLIASAAGLWAAACLAGGVVAAGGIRELPAQWMTAVFGL